MGFILLPSFTVYLNLVRSLPAHYKSREPTNNLAVRVSASLVGFASSSNGYEAATAVEAELGAEAESACKQLQRWYLNI